jgi:hypothetical protein
MAETALIGYDISGAAGREQSAFSLAGHLINPLS